MDEPDSMNVRAMICRNRDWTDTWRRVPVMMAMGVRSGRRRLRRRLVHMPGSFNAGAVPTFSPVCIAGVGTRLQERERACREPHHLGQKLTISKH